MALLHHLTLTDILDLLFRELYVSSANIFGRRPNNK